jgi:6,7-dimethyl-8-ribityllumazine synthase
MATNLKKKNNLEIVKIPPANEYVFAIIVSDWHKEITQEMLKGAHEALINNGAEINNIHIKHVPGSFELVSGAKMVADNLYVDAIICLGCVIRGETNHYDYVCQGVTHGISQLNVEYAIPFIFGVLTTDNIEQAKERAGGKYGNKGEEAAITAIKMAALARELEETSDLPDWDDIDYFDQDYSEQDLN